MHYSKLARRAKEGFSSSAAPVSDGPMSRNTVMRDDMAKRNAGLAGPTGEAKSGSFMARDGKSFF